MYCNFSCPSSRNICKTGIIDTTARDCSEVQSQGHNCSGVYTIFPSNDIKKDVWCDLYTQGGRWTVLQQRRNGFVDFDRVWSHYENGFGDPNTEYWIGNEALYHLTLSGGNELLILMQTWDGVWKHAYYIGFCIGHKNDNYRLHLSEYSGSAGDSLLSFGQAGQQFSTQDVDNDPWGPRFNPTYHKGGFWFKNCCRADLNGFYYSTGVEATDSCHWRTFTGLRESLKTIYMMFR
ncbi:angiopoietin-related protein 6-like [Mytilus edulis]|uniref:angiopoietin-related protein 6-like n=1 Tax=Mytilus edulis TaxID=6550 RepID=UPI0039EF02FB